MAPLRTGIGALMCFVFLFLGTSLVKAEDWKPIEPAHLALKAPLVDSGADAEAIFWEVRVNDSETDPTFDHYIRIKVFTERGVEKQSKIDIIYPDKIRIRGISGRTIQPDGSIQELKKDGIFERTVIKANKTRFKARSFTLPGVKIGSIIEYKWSESRPSGFADNVPLRFQRDIPCQSVSYLIKPWSDRNSNIKMRSIVFNGPEASFDKGNFGFTRISMKNRPAVIEEPMMPPDDEIENWMLLYYTELGDYTPEKYWKDMSRRLYDVTRGYIKPNDEVKQLAASLVAGIPTPEQKIEKLFWYCRTKVKNTTYEDLPNEDKLKENKSPGNTLKNGYGDAADINYLFGAMCAAAGLDPRVALVPDRGQKFFDMSHTLFFMEQIVIAIRVGANWQFLDPGTSYVPVGMRKWQGEGTQALILDEKESKFVMTNPSPTANSSYIRNAKLELSEDGTLEGDIRIVLTGHVASEEKLSLAKESPADQEKEVLSDIKKRMQTAECTDLKIEHLDMTDQPVVYSFHVKIPGYAQRTGKRLFIKPMFFQYNEPVLFTNPQRNYSVYFHYGWAEDDTIELKLPAGFELEGAQSPGGISFGQVGGYEAKLSRTQDGSKIFLKRKLTFGNDGMILFPKDSYPQLKVIFEKIHQFDDYSLTLKQAQAASNQ